MRDGDVEDLFLGGETTGDETAAEDLCFISRTECNEWDITRTSNILLKILPNILACTIRICFSLNAIMLTINSTAFPNVAFSNPPIVWPNFAASSSVANASNPASGTIARKFSTNTATGSQPATPATIPSGTKTSKMLA